jgi:hypothetical protein
MAAVYPPGEVWAGQIPAAVFFDGPVVKLKVGLEAALAGR